ncbi:hypothetical protein KZZ52_21870 [Dactylosporangium sp. AC04546]|uniref:hypothetical protein n=1 Tax=Dactylosporangium sp. AC04546 TaxID=2862460 RepID=UPI001EDCC67D|nr:hypothetical protein [Dactylosporangium sp. AC04546]WVK87930.1 hypothetical protein KZZ52_21870 [Dactylosporangium sp. AC04546]
MTIARVAAAGFGIIALFQLALAAGAPLGRAAWGGAHAGQLPPNLRVASLVALLIWAVAALVVLRRAGLAATVLPAGVGTWGTWVLAGLLTLGALMNLASSSPWERFIWAPLAATLAVLCFLLARSPAAA